MLTYLVRFGFVAAKPVFSSAKSAVNITSSLQSGLPNLNENTMPVSSH